MELIACELSKKRLKGDIMNYFTERVRSGLHICLNFSPVGKLRQRIRQFPSIINCCTINWLRPWPEGALLLIGEQLLTGLEMQNSVDRVTNLLVNAHRLVEKQAEQFQSSLGRTVYITPKNFIVGVELYREQL